MLSEEQISAIRTVLQNSGIVQRAWLFGSVARNEEGPGSDIDIMYERIPGIRFGLLKLSGVIIELERATDKNVDFVSVSGMRESVKENAIQDRILIYERHMEKKTRITFRLRVDLMDALKARAARENRSLNNLVENLIAAHLRALDAEGQKQK